MKKKNKLERKVNCNAIKLPRHRDGGELFVPYCTLPYHMGPIKDTTKCKRNKCRHYTKLYISLGDKPYVE